MTPCKPIIFSGPMVRAILAGTKTMTRRVLKPQPICHDGLVPSFSWGKFSGLYPDDWFGYGNEIDAALPYTPGTRLWVRERLDEGAAGSVVYHATGDVHPDAEWVWQRKSLPSIHCPRGLSRITMEVTDVRVQRLQDISEEDAKAEGVERLKSGRGYYSAKHGRGAVHFGVYHDYATEAFADLWETIHGPDAWNRNDWVAAYSFRRVG